MITRYVRVKDRRTGHEYDVLEQQVDEKKHEVLDREHYPVTSRPRPAKPNRSKGGGSARSRSTDPAELTIKTSRPELVVAAEAAGIDPTDLTKQQILDALAAPKTSNE